MGAFFTNIQLKFDQVDTNGSIETTIAAIRDIHSTRGYLQVEEERKADKTIIIASPANNPWISIYDEETEEQDLKLLKKLAADLSKRLSRPAISVLVNDSDTVNLGVYTNGKLKDSLSNTSKGMNFSKSKPDEWLPVLAAGYHFDDIKNAWHSDAIFVEDFLNRFSALANVDSAHILTGYEYCKEQGMTNTTVLHFASTVKKPARVIGDAKFSMRAGVGMIDVKKGARSTHEWWLVNHGASCNGFQVVIAGECIEKKLLVPESVVAIHQWSNTEVTSSFTEGETATGEKLFYVQEEGLVIPEGFEPNYPLKGKELKEYTKAVWDNIIRFRITFMGTSDESGELKIWISPLSNIQDGAFFEEIRKETVKEHFKRQQEMMKGHVNE